MSTFPESGFSVLQQRTPVGSPHGSQARESPSHSWKHVLSHRDEHQRITWTRENRPAARFLNGDVGPEDLLAQGCKMASSGLKNINTYYAQVGNAAQNP